MKAPVIAVVLPLLAPVVFADAERGKQLHDESCLKCHGTEVYSRADRFIGSRDALEKQVNRCKTNVGVQWFDEDVANVVEYLDQSFYHFK